MGCVVLCVVLFAFSVCGDVDIEKIAEASERSRALRDDFFDNKWKAVDAVPLDTSGLIPDTHPQPNSQQPQFSKRRRLRKRKRRPPVISLTEDVPEVEKSTNTHQHLLDEQQSWSDMEGEFKSVPSKRRRIVPAFELPKFGEKEVKIVSEESEREPVADLKILLKQAGSLSEILQRRNLTLADLLTGEKKILEALTEKPEVEMITDYKYPVIEEEFSKILHKEKPMEVVKELSLQENIKYEIIKEQKPRYNNVIVVDYKPSLEISEITKVSPQTETPKPQTSNLPITSAKINQRIKTTTVKNEVNTTKPKPIKISITELLGAQETKNDKGPLRMSINLNELIQNGTVPDKIKFITAKDEIFEILKDENSKANLTKILESRNMTIDDLVELRERGSSQRHLADLFHNKTREPEPIDEAFVGFITNPQTERIPKSKNSFKKPTASPLEESSEIKLSSFLEENKEKNKYTVTSFPTYKIEMDKKYKEIISEPIWKDYDKLYHSTHQKGTVENVDPIDLYNDVENTISERLNNQLAIDKLQDEEGNVFIKLPYGVKHAILASLLIIAISLFIFITILVVFKWSQKRKKRLCYNGSFNCSKIKSPILEEAATKTTFRNFVSETLGRKKQFHNKDLQSMSDAWENDRKPFQ